MMIGFWFGKQDLKSIRFVQKSAIISLLLFVITLLFSEGIISLLSEGNDLLKSEYVQILGTSPMPPLPLYMISGSSIAIFIISICILWGEKTEKSFMIKALSKTGKLALTFYVAHVIIGMGIIYLLYPDKVGSLGIEFSLSYALIFSVACIIFASFWLNRKKIGPLELIMRKLTN